MKRYLTEQQQPAIQEIHMSGYFLEHECAIQMRCAQLRVMLCTHVCKACCLALKKVGAKIFQMNSWVMRGYASIALAAGKTKLVRTNREAASIRTTADHV
jgi:hypothetical protein